MKLKLTEEQCHIIDFVKQMKRGQKLKIEAKAGSGKTSTLVEVAKANPDKRFLYLAFNKAIVNDASQKFPANVVVKTTHSLAYGKIVMPLRKKDPTFRVQGKITMFELKDWFMEHDALYKRYLKANPSDEAGEGKAYQWDSIAFVAARYNEYLNSDKEEHTQSKLFQELSRAIRDGELSYTHSFYLKEYQLLRKHPEIDQKFDCILLDEAQDTNPVTMGIVNDVTCSKILVGDSNQSIYAFRGAVNALATFQADETLYLTCCFRCNQPIVDRANYFLKKYDPTEHPFRAMRSNRPDGKSNRQSAAIIARTNSGLISAFEELLHDHSLSYQDIIFTRPPSEIFAPSLNVLKFQAGADARELAAPFRYFKRFDDIYDLKNYAEDTSSYEVMMAIKLVEDYGHSIFGLYEKANQCAVCNFTMSDNKTITLTTAHSSKGLEFDEVALLGDFTRLADIQDEMKTLIQDGAPAGDINSVAQSLYEETNLYYVALTRARSVLFDLTENGVEFDKSTLLSSLDALSFPPSLFFLPDETREEAIKALSHPQAQQEEEKDT